MSSTSMSTMSMSATSTVQSDTITRNLVESELSWSSQITEPTAIAVAVQAGIVTLTGSVPSFLQKVAAGKAALRVKGVHAVANDIDVTIGHLDSDAAIAERAAIALTLESSVPSDTIQAEVTNGVVILSGTVPWQFQSSAAAAAVGGLRGVREVRNEITVIPRSSSEDALEHIRQALARQATIDATHIKVHVDGTTVTLTGDVSSNAAKLAAADAVWHSPHVATVVNDLRVVS